MPGNVRLGYLGPTMSAQSIINSDLTIKCIALAITGIGMGIRKGFDDRIIRTHWIGRCPNHTLYQVSAPSFIRANSVDRSTANNSAIAKANVTFVRGHRRAQKDTKSPTHIKFVPPFLGNIMKHNLAELNNSFTNFLAMQVMVSSVTRRLYCILIQKDSRILNQPSHDWVLARDSSANPRL